MTFKLIGGPKDGDTVDIDPLLYFDGVEYYFPHPNLSEDLTDREVTSLDVATRSYVISTYRWVSGPMDHLDFVGYQK